MADKKHRQINGRQVITWRWWREGGDVDPRHEETLNERALELIHTRIAQGYVQGELGDYVRTVDEDGVHYRGWWGLGEYTEAPPSTSLEVHSALEWNALQVAVDDLVEYLGDVLEAEEGDTEIQLRLGAAKALKLRLADEPAGFLEEFVGQPNTPELRERVTRTIMRSLPGVRRENLIKELLDEGIEPAHLDEAVHDAASGMASGANNEGLEVQVDFLLGAGDWKPADILFKSREAKEGDP